MRRILACVDGSEQSRWGATLSVQLAARMDAAVTLVHAIVPLPYPNMPGHVSHAHREHERTILEALMQNFGAAPTSASVLVGPPAEAISEAAKDEDVILVVAGARGRGLSRLFLGSVSDRLAQISPKPVLLVRDGQSILPGPGTWIAAGVDGSPESSAAVHMAAELARATGASLRLVYVAPEPLKHGPEAFTFNIVAWEPEHEAWAMQLLREANAREARAGLVIETKLLKGPAADRLADLAQAPEVAMVVVGHRGRGAIQRLLLGSVADRLAQLSPKPVLIVR